LIKPLALRSWKFLKSIQLTIVLLSLLMALVVLCTLAQVEMGTAGAVNAYMRSFLVWRQFSFLPFPIPVFPGAALVGLILTLNLTAKTLVRYQGYGFLASQPDPPIGGTSNVLAKGVTDCSFKYDAAVVAARAALITLRLTLSANTVDGTETVSLYHAVHVDNLP